jgi:hypothetical protein
MIFLDECQAIKERTSQQSHILHLYEDFFEYRYLMSGSMGYKIDEYYSYLTFLAKDIIRTDFYGYMSLIANMGNQYSQYQVSSYKEDRIKMLKERLINKLQTSYKSEDCLDLPPNIEDRIYIKMTDKMRRFYESFINYAISEEENIVDHNGRQILTSFGYYMQATSDPLLLKGKFDCPELKTWKFTDNPKWTITKSLIDNYNDEGKKICIRANNPAVLERIAIELKKKKLKVIVIHGGLHSKIRGMNHDQYCNFLLESFKKPENENNIILISNKKYYSSINLLEVTRTIYWDRDPNPEYYDQSKKRSNRHGTTETTKCDLLLFNNSIDIYIDECILGPKKDTQNLLTSNHNLTLEEYKKIFNARKEDYIFKTGRRKRSEK